MRPRYADLFRRMLDPEQELADAAYDAVLFERADAVPDLVACYEACAAPPARGRVCRPWPGPRISNLLSSRR
jgi:hypothetical protein